MSDGMDWEQYRHETDWSRDDAWKLNDFDEDMDMLESAAICDHGIRDTEAAFKRIRAYIKYLEGDDDNR